MLVKDHVKREEAAGDQQRLLVTQRSWKAQAGVQAEWSPSQMWSNGAGIQLCFAWSLSYPEGYSQK